MLFLLTMPSLLKNLFVLNCAGLFSIIPLHHFFDAGDIITHYAAFTACDDWLPVTLKGKTLLVITKNESLTQSLQ